MQMITRRQTQLFLCQTGSGTRGLPNPRLLVMIVRPKSGVGLTSKFRVSVPVNGGGL